MLREREREREEKKKKKKKFWKGSKNSLCFSFVISLSHTHIPQHGYPVWGVSSQFSMVASHFCLMLRGSLLSTSLFALLLLLLLLLLALSSSSSERDPLKRLKSSAAFSSLSSLSSSSFFLFLSSVCFASLRENEPPLSFRPFLRIFSRRDELHPRKMKSSSSSSSSEEEEEEERRELFL